MKYVIYSLYDRKSKTYNSPIFLVNDEVAIRNIRSILQDTSSLISQYPDDFALCKLGEFSPDTGDLTPFLAVVIEVKDLVQRGAAVGGGTPPQEVLPGRKPSETA